ncbi:molybdenum cofactor biosynthesis protein B [Bryobacterales bacterium F-183]|nr:molybdenum cofactor biosynthesis protein B [Bryobacterales bacterium F-183]
MTPTEQHKAKAESIQLQIAIVTVSDTRTPETDKNAHYLTPAILEAGHNVSDYRIIKDEPKEVARLLDEIAAHVILFNGGTGFSQRDTTFDALSAKLEKTMPGFGELFRMLSYEQVGAAAMLSRATAGIYRGKMVFSTPGSPNAVKLAWEKLIQPELRHLASELAR